MITTQTLSALQAQCETAASEQQLSDRRDRLLAAKEQWDHDNPGREAEIVAAALEDRTAKWKAAELKARTAQHVQSLTPNQYQLEQWIAAIAPALWSRSGWLMQRPRGG